MPEPFKNIKIYLKSNIPLHHLHSCTTRNAIIAQGKHYAECTAIRHRIESNWECNQRLPQQVLV